MGVRARPPDQRRVDGQLIVDEIALVRQAAQGGAGIADLMESRVRDDIAVGRLVRVLDDWCPPSPGYHLYYRS